MNFDTCSALISGGAGGLGGATARRLHAMGLAVIILEPELSRAKALADELGDRAVGVAGDHGSDEDVHAAIEVAQSLGTFSVNVNAAGLVLTSPPTATPEGVPHDMATFRAMIEMHVMGPFNISRLCAAAFAKNDPDADGQRGVIINTSSTAAWDGQARQVAYSTAKAGIVGMTLTMARDLADIGVRSCSIAPGGIMTPRLASAPPDLKAKLASNIAFPKRFGHVEEYASLVEGILRTPFLNGQSIRLDGALSTALGAIG